MKSNNNGGSAPSSPTASISGDEFENTVEAPIEDAPIQNEEQNLFWQVPEEEALENEKNSSQEKPVHFDPLLTQKFFNPSKLLKKETTDLSNILGEERQAQDQFHTYLKSELGHQFIQKCNNLIAHFKPMTEEITTVFPFSQPEKTATSLQKFTNDFTCPDSVGVNEEIDKKNYLLYYQGMPLLAKITELMLEISKEKQLTAYHITLLEIMIEEMAVCGPGALAKIQNTYEMLLAYRDLPSRLQKIRHEIVLDFLKKEVNRIGVKESMVIHYVNAATRPFMEKIGINLVVDENEEYCDEEAVEFLVNALHENLNNLLSPLTVINYCVNHLKIKDVNLSTVPPSMAIEDLITELALFGAEKQSLIDYTFVLNNNRLTWKADYSLFLTIFDRLCNENYLMQPISYEAEAKGYVSSSSGYQTEIFYLNYNHNFLPKLQNFIELTKKQYLTDVDFITMINIELTQQELMTSLAESLNVLNLDKLKSLLNTLTKLYNNLLIANITNKEIDQAFIELKYLMSYNLHRDTLKFAFVRGKYLGENFQAQCVPLLPYFAELFAGNEAFFTAEQSYLKKDHPETSNMDKTSQNYKYFMEDLKEYEKNQIEKKIFGSWFCSDALNHYQRTDILIALAKYINSYEYGLLKGKSSQNYQQCIAFIISNLPICTDFETIISVLSPDEARFVINHTELSALATKIKNEESLSLALTYLSSEKWPAFKLLMDKQNLPNTCYASYYYHAIKLNLVDFFLNDLQLINNETLFHVFSHAIKHANFTVFDFLLNQQFDFSKIKGPFGDTLLHLTAGLADPLFLEILLLSELDTDVLNDRAENPLVIAVNNKRYENVKLLLQSKADVTQCDVMSIAIRTQQIEIIKLMIKFGIDLSQKNDDNDTYLHLAVEVDSLDIVKLVYTKQTINMKNDENETPLYLAVFNRNLSMVKLLMELGADANIKDAEGRTVLIPALTHSPVDPEMIKYLLKNLPPESLMILDRFSLTALNYAVISDQPEIVKLILQHNPKIPDQKHIQAHLLTTAINNNNLEILKILCSVNITLDLHFPVDHSPLLHLAIEKGNVDIVYYLLKCNASLLYIKKTISSPSSSILPVQLAIQLKNRKIVQHLLNCHHEVEKNLVEQAAQLNDVQAITSKLQNLFQIAYCTKLIVPYILEKFKNNQLILNWVKLHYPVESFSKKRSYTELGLLNQSNEEDCSPSEIETPDLIQFPKKQNTQQ